MNIVISPTREDIKNIKEIQKSKIRILFQSLEIFQRIKVLVVALKLFLKQLKQSKTKIG